jgi:spore coat protein SA
MRLLIIAPEQIPVPPPVGGSVEHSVYSIAKQISSKHKVTIVSKWRSSYPKRSVIGNVTILRVPGGSRDSYLRNVLNAVKGSRYDMIQIDNRPRFVKRVKNTFPATPVSVFLHSTTFISPPMTSTKQAAADLHYADLIVGNSSSLRSLLKKRFPKERHKVRFVHLGVDLQQYRPPSQEQRDAARGKNNVSGKFVLLFAGRLIPRKGIPVLMKAVRIAKKSIPSVKLLIAGGTGKPAYKAYLKRMAGSLNIPVTFKGYVQRSGMPRFYWTGDIFICPSQGHEAFGLVNVEAMASGVPCIASKNGGIPEIVRHNRNGLLVANYRSPEAFAKAIVRAAKSPSLLKRLAQNARKDAVSMFSWRTTARKLESIYARSKKS